MSSRHHIDDFAKILTGSGRGAVAVVLIQGRSISAKHPADQLFRSVSGKTLSQCEVGKINYGHWSQEDVVVVRTSREQWELSCHGGSAAVRKILAELNQAGIAEPKITGQRDQSSHPANEWEHLLLHSRTVPIADLILAQPRLLTKWIGSLEQQVGSSDIRTTVNEILQWQPFTDHLIEPWVVAIAGKPNAGKSSLLNAIVGYRRSIVFEEPGTTRDAIQCDVVIDGWPVRLVDTAGIRDDSVDQIERLGMTSAKKTIQTADLCLTVVDQTKGWSAEDQQLADFSRRHAPIAIVQNKEDLCPTGSTDCLDHYESQPEFRVSSKTGDGIEELLQWISKSLVPNPPQPNQPLPVFSEFRSACLEFMSDSDSQKLMQRLCAIPSQLADINLPSRLRRG